MRGVSGQDRGESRRPGDLIVYGVVPYLLVAAPLLIVLLSVMLGGCTSTRTDSDWTERARFYSGTDSRVGKELASELKQRETRAVLQHVIDEAQR